MFNACEALPRLCFLPHHPPCSCLTQRGLHSPGLSPWSPVPLRLYLMHLAAHLVPSLMFNNTFEVPCRPPSSPIVDAHPPTNSHPHSCSMHVRLSLIWTWLGLAPTHRPLTSASCPPHYVSCSMHPTHLV